METKERFIYSIPIQTLTACSTCKNLNLDTGTTCKAFPGGIPQIILDGENDHSSNFAGDGGITYSAKAGLSDKSQI